MSDVYIVGIDMIPFGRYPDQTVAELGAQAALLALDDASLTIHDMQAFYCGNLMQANNMIGQRILHEIGETGIPVVNTANACATGATAVRTVYMTNHTEAQADSWMGWSNGRWEGESLVVDTRGFNDLSWFDRAGNFHSDALHVVERFTPRSADTLLYEATIEDPKVFTRPWKMSMPLYRRVEANAQILEFRCVEFVEDLMYGHLRKEPRKQ